MTAVVTTKNETTAAAPFNLPAVLLFSISTVMLLTVFPIYAWFHDFSGAAWAWFFIFLFASGLSITGGYHRLWAHRAYEARLPLRIFYMLFGAQSLENSILVWASMHRVHHKNVDDIENDPYSIKRGFWYAHMGWMLRDQPCHKVDLSNVQDLQRDPVVMFQHKHYLGLALFMNIGLPGLVGLAYGEPGGFLMLAGLARLVLNHHFTFFINSLAHMWGRRPYTEDNSARDNDLIALFTYGEGYHNYHHLFSWDYRNGVRWWNVDLTKWWIALWSWMGLAHNLRRVPEFKIRRAMIERQFARAHEKLAQATPTTRLDTVRRLLEQEMDAFKSTVNEWTRLQSEKIETAKRQVMDRVAERWEHSEARRRLQALEDALQAQYRRVRLLHLQTAAA
ncbi:MAG: acyl-CoA desaturase [Panacagrimonas sp.]|jgi:stearoyl-CoA desaturase (delta-9 desaturase)|nr:fatty acid desaturase [Panacagrimonas sp.]MCC2657044.1 acyl-CoA desaturase [Panacagrimonas sp.]